METSLLQQSFTKGKSLLSFLRFLFFVKADWNNPYAREAYFGVAYSTYLDMDVPQFAYAFIYWRTFWFPQVFSHLWVELLCIIASLFAFGHRFSKQLLKYWKHDCWIPRWDLFSFGKKWQTVLQSGCTCIPPVSRESSCWFSPSSNWYCHYFEFGSPDFGEGAVSSGEILIPCPGIEPG